MALGDVAYKIKQGNLESPLTVYLEDDTGRIPTFSGKSVKFFIWSDGATTYDVAENRDGEIVDADTGEVKMAWQSGDVDQAGIFHIEVDLVSSGNRRETFPADGSLTLVVTPRHTIP